MYWGLGSTFIPPEAELPNKHTDVYFDLQQSVDWFKSKVLCKHVLRVHP